MKKFVIITSIALVAGNMAFGQTTAQTGVVGPSGESVYSLQVTGADGVTYNCRPDIVQINGVPSRPCVRAGSTPPAWQGGLSGGAGAGLIGLVFLAALAGDDGTTSTTTSTN